MCFLKKRRILRHFYMWWRHYGVKNVGIDPILLRQVCIAIMNNCVDFWNISSFGTLFFRYTSFCRILVRLPLKEMPSVTSRRSDVFNFCFIRRQNTQFTSVLNFKYLAHRHHPQFWSQKSAVVDPSLCFTLVKKDCALPH